MKPMTEVTADVDVQQILHFPSYANYIFQQSKAAKGLIGGE
jgi:hypothetical protein